MIEQSYLDALLESNDIDELRKWIGIFNKENAGLKIENVSQAGKIRKLEFEIIALTKELENK